MPPFQPLFIHALIAICAAFLAILHFVRADVAPWQHRFISEYAVCIPGSRTNRHRWWMFCVFILAAMVSAAAGSALFNQRLPIPGILLIITAVTCVVMARYPTDLNVHRDTLVPIPEEAPCPVIPGAGAIHDISALIGFSCAAVACLWVAALSGSALQPVLAISADIGMVLQFSMIARQRMRTEWAPYRWVGLWERIAIGGFLAWLWVWSGT